MSGYGYDGYGYDGNRYSSYGYDGGGGFYSVFPGGYNAQPIYLSGPGASGYYSYHSGSTKFINSAYENYNGGKSTYAATLSTSGAFTQSTYNYSSPYRTVSEIVTYTSHSALNVSAYYGYNDHQSSADHQSIDITTYSSGDYRYFNTVSFDSQSFFDGSSSASYSDTTLTEENGVTVGAVAGVVGI